MPKNTDEALRQLPRPTILAFATAMYAIVRAQIAAGKKLTPREQMIVDKANAFFNPPNRKPS